MAKELQNVIANTIRDGMYVGWMVSDEKETMFLMPLDIQYCRIYGKTHEGEWIVYFDAAYFDNGSQYVAKQLKFSLARLGITVRQAPLRSGKSKGKIEKFHQVVDAFLR